MENTALFNKARKRRLGGRILFLKTLDKSAFTIKLTEVIEMYFGITSKKSMILALGILTRTAQRMHKINWELTLRLSLIALEIPLLIEILKTMKKKTMCLNLKENTGMNMELIFTQVL